MAFTLSGVVPWGRNMSEYRLMFNLSDSDMKLKIAGFGDGPASFNCEASALGCDVTSFDPIYRFSAEKIAARIEETRSTVMKQMSENLDNYIWNTIKSLDELENIRMSAMRLFLSDYEKGRREGRYVAHELPKQLPYECGAFDLGLSSHFLLMYASLGYDFHIKAMLEMLRVCREIRIFPIVDLNANKTELANEVISYFRTDYDVNICSTKYAFQKGENKLLTIKYR